MLVRQYRHSGMPVISWSIFFDCGGIILDVGRKGHYLYCPKVTSMHTAFPIISMFVLAWFTSGCSKPAEEAATHDHEPAGLEEGKLYDEVMKLHDEGMARMDEIYTLKQELMKKVADPSGLVREKQEDIESKISQLDSASRAMMVWMRNFHPESDTLDTIGYRDYLETELKKVKKVRDDIFAAVARAKEE